MWRTIGVAIKRGLPPEKVDAWRLPHGALCSGGGTLIAIASAFAQLTLAEWITWGIMASFVVSGYSFALVLPLSAFWGQRGLGWRAPATNKMVYVGNSLGAYSSLFGAFLLVVAAAVALH